MSYLVIAQPLIDRVDKLTFYDGEAVAENEVESLDLNSVTFYENVSAMTTMNDRPKMIILDFH